MVVRTPAHLQSPPDAAISNSDAPRPRLAICTAMTATRGSRDGSFVLTRKFIEGVKEYGRHWPGEIHVWVQRVDAADSNLDHVEVHPDELPFHLHWLGGNEQDPQRFDDMIASAEVILAALVDRHVTLASMCRSASVPLVYVTEYSVRTRQQIVRTETRNLIVRWRRHLWTTRLEQAYRRAVQLAAGVQCNGLPTYNAYHAINNHCLLYFDTRVRADNVVAVDVLQTRVNRLRDDEPLRLAFSGRLIAMKGADHLPLVADALRRRGVSFTLDICGGGALESSMREHVRRHGLESQVRFRGVLDFESQLLPLISREIDLFVCCHRQGDPSCTYLETYSCGVPIVGYDNEALAGLVRTSGVGGPAWATAMDEPVTLAARITDLNMRRAEIADASHKARAFASQHTFERTMKLRVQHLLDRLHAHQNVDSGTANP